MGISQLMSNCSHLVKQDINSVKFVKHESVGVAWQEKSLYVGERQCSNAVPVDNLIS